MFVTHCRYELFAITYANGSHFIASFVTAKGQHLIYDGMNNCCTDYSEKDIENYKHNHIVLCKKL